MLTEQADVSAAFEMKDQDARGWLSTTPDQHAARTQAGLRDFLTLTAWHTSRMGREHDVASANQEL